MLLWTLFLTLLLTIPVFGENVIKSSALLSCMENSQFTASTFDVQFFPSNGSVSFDITAISTIEGNVTAQIEVIAYGYTAVDQTIDVCSLNLNQLCPISAGHFDITANIPVSQTVISQVPGIAYTIPDLDGMVRVMVYPSGGNKTAIACVEATLSNGKTVQTKYVSWGLAAVIALGCLTAGTISLLGHQSTSSHIASNTVSLFVYFQSVAIISMMAVERLPPIAAAWAQNFQWTMGIIRVGFMQKIFNWYVQSTGGTATNILPNKDIISIEVEKRDLTGILPALGNYASRHVRTNVARNIYRAMVAVGRDGLVPQLAPRSLLKRSVDLIGRASPAAANDPVTSDETDPNLGQKTLVLRGMQRVAFLANIELSNLFLTGLTFFILLGVFCFIALAITKGIMELLVRMQVIQHDRFTDFRRGWRVVTKGILFRLLLVGFAQLSVLCLWELTERDSPAVIVLAILAYLIVVAVLGFAAYRVIMLARRSTVLHQNPAYTLFSDPATLNRLGFLYVQFRATAYYFIVPLLIYTFCKSCFIAFGQPSGKVQAMGVFLIELAYLIGICYVKPYMDKTTNGINIAISVINFINALFFLFFSQLFNQPDMVSSIMAVVFFILNAVFSLILLIMIIVSCVWAIMAKNPDTRYQPMRDDRESFMRDINITEKKRATELDALGVTARGEYDEGSGIYSKDDEDSEFNNASKVSFQDTTPTNDSFPQARLSRKNDRAPNPFDSFENYNHPNFSSASIESPARGGSPVFPQQTGYQGYHPANDQMYQGSGYRREPPRF
jgi:hypothetical protein